MWKVVGGQFTGGIIVREDEDLGSQKLETRLATGSWVMEEEVVGLRLRYTLKAGDGPQTGWVTTTLGHKTMLIKEQLVREWKNARWQSMLASLKAGRSSKTSQIANFDTVAGCGCKKRLCELANICRVEEVLRSECYSSGVISEAIPEAIPVFRLSLTAEDRPSLDDDDDDDYMPSVELVSSVKHDEISDSEGMDDNNFMLIMSDDEMSNDEREHADNKVRTVDSSMYDIEAEYAALAIDVTSDKSTLLNADTDVALRKARMTHAALGFSSAQPAIKTLKISEAFDVEEKRVEKDDHSGMAYTFQGFVEYYGQSEAMERWQTASPQAFSPCKYSHAGGA